MTKRRYVLTAIAVITVAVVFIISVFPFNSIIATQLKTLQAQLRPQGIECDVREVDFHLPAHLRLLGVGLQIQQPNLYLPLFIDQADLKPSLLSLITGSPQAAADLKSYRGDISAWIQMSRGAEPHTVKASIRKILLGEHPTLRFFGVEGELSAETDLTIVPTPLVSLRSVEGNIEVTVRDGVIRQPIPVAPLISIPALQDLFLVAKAERRGDKLEVTKLSLRSSLGKAAGKGQFILDSRGQIIGQECSALIEFTEEGHKQYGGFLALAAGEPLDTTIRKWSVRVSQQPGYPLTTVVTPK